MKIPMKRDFDLIREILLEIEGGRKVFEIRSNETSAALGIDEEGSMSREEADNWNHQLKLLQDTGLVEFRQSGGGVWFAENISWEGHDFLDSVRDPEIWKKTKDGAKSAGGFTFEVLVAVAKGLIKTKLEKHTGVDIDL